LSGIYLGIFSQNRPIWCFNHTAGVSGVSGYEPGFCSVDTWGSWQNYLGSQGSTDQAWLGKLFRSREHWKMVPDIAHTVMTAGFSSGSTLATTSRTSDGQTIIAYLADGNARARTINMSKIADSGGLAHAWWFNPSSGATTDLGTFTNSGTHNFTAPDANDWLLVIDANSANLPAPGSADL